MGMLTTIVIWNDYLSDLLKKPKKLAELILNHVSSGELTTESNEIKLFRTRHANNHTIYVFMGNTVSEMNAYSLDTKNLARNYPEFFDHMVNYMEYQLKKLKELQEEYSKIQNEKQT